MWHDARPCERACHWVDREILWVMRARFCGMARVGKALERRNVSEVSREERKLQPRKEMNVRVQWYCLYFCHFHFLREASRRPSRFSCAHRHCQLLFPVDWLSLPLATGLGLVLTQGACLMLLVKSTCPQWKREHGNVISRVVDGIPPSPSVSFGLSWSTVLRRMVWHAGDIGFGVQFRLWSQPSPVWNAWHAVCFLFA